MKDLFSELSPPLETITEGITLFPNYVDTKELFAGILRVAESAPFRHMRTPGGHRMSVAMTNCGEYGWTSGKTGYNYSTQDPVSGINWPQMPVNFLSLARSVAAKAGFQGFTPDSCLINRYEPGTKLTPHQDRNECDMRWPIVSVSIGVPAVFQFFGDTRSGKAQNICLQDGDVLVWGGKARLNYHAVKKLEPAVHDHTGRFRYNLTFRKAV